jgi:RNA polymerase sigma-70 factor (ECF subfamily)
METTADREADRTTGAVVDLDMTLEVFLAQRTRLFRIAYRVTGDVSSAEDVVQEAWLRWQRTDRRVIKNPAAFLTTTTTHLAINVIQSARHRHEAPTELPLSDLVETGQDPTNHAEQTLAVEEILLVLMARLRPAELTVYLLRKGFDYPYGDIACLLHTSSANARQLARRAQQRIEGGSERPVDVGAHQRLVVAFLAAARTGELAALEMLLTREGRPSIRPHRRPSVRRFCRPAPPYVARRPALPAGDRGPGVYQ